MGGGGGGGQLDKNPKTGIISEVIVVDSID